jgi:deoxycytidylate deaminase
MSFTLGSIIVKGGKVISTGFNHQRPRFDDDFSRTADKPVSMHAEMHAIFNLTGGRAPPTKQHVKENKETRFPPKPPQRQGYGLRPQPFWGFQIPC